MKSAASPTLPQEFVATTPRMALSAAKAAAPVVSQPVAPKAVGGIGRVFLATRRWMNKASADFWLSFFFWHARRQPWFARGTKPFFLYFVWNYSAHLYGGTMANAARILGPSSTLVEREALARRIIGNFYDFVCDVGLCLGQSPEEMAQRIDRVEGHELYDSIRHSGKTAGKGAIIATAHMGSFEVGAAALMQHEKRLHVLFRRDKLDLFEQIRSTLRKKIGVVEVPLDQGWTIWMRLRDALANDEVVLIQGDRVMPGQKGQPVKFFDGHILMPTGPARLAMVSGSPIIPVFSVRTPKGKIRLFIEEPILVGDMPGGVSLDEAMNKLAAVLEKYVRKYPDQWLENR
ncbi:MAG TPA: lysophospholipid acyltransferase family protein, partial [Rhizomicrobium sp.]|nr:lysophospholipid acyltransferase family protein [Rhizomicrobium sp.]